MSRGQLWVLLVVAIAVLVTATSVVYAKYASRKEFVALQQLRVERDRIDVEWGRLQLEQGTLATHGQIESVAIKRLKMRTPSAEEVVVIKP